ncbi:MAG: hypothetical protein GX265_04840 [Mollicutes bacterium]|nr:hypothetical protein [Mollicutes bacterium]
MITRIIKNYYGILVFYLLLILLMLAMSYQNKLIDTHGLTVINVKIDM